MSTLNERLLGAKVRQTRENRGLTQAELGEAIGTSQQTVDRIERGQTTRSKWMAPLLRFLDLRDVAEDYERTLKARQVAEDPIFGDRSDPHLLPVFSISNIDEDDNVMSGQPVDYIERPFNMKHSSRGYAVIVPDNMMVPAYRLRDIVFLNPVYTAAAGDDVLLARKVEAGWTAKLAHILTAEAGRLQIRQWAQDEPEWVDTGTWRRQDPVIARFLRG